MPSSSLIYLSVLVGSFFRSIFGILVRPIVMPNMFIKKKTACNTDPLPQKAAQKKETEHELPHYDKIEDILNRIQDNPELLPHFPLEELLQEGLERINILIRDEALPLLDVRPACTYWVAMWIRAMSLSHKSIPMLLKNISQAPRHYWAEEGFDKKMPAMLKVLFTEKVGPFVVTHLERSSKIKKLEFSKNEGRLFLKEMFAVYPFESKHVIFYAKDTLKHVLEDASQEQLAFSRMGISREELDFIIEEFLIVAPTPKPVLT